MTKINYQALREAAERAIPAMERLLMLPVDDDLISEQELKDYGVDIDALNAFKFLAGPETVLALLDELERNQQYIKRRDQENEEIALTVGKLRVELEAAEKRIAELESLMEPKLPQPAVVDNDKFRADFERWMVEDEKCIVGSSDPYPAGIESRNWRAWNACRAAMLHGAEPVSQTYKLPPLSSNEVNDAAWKLHNMLTEHGPLNGRQFNNLKGCFYEALKVAMRNYPVTPDGWISCSERMPDKLIPVMVMYEDGEMWSAMWNGNRWDDGTEYPDPHSVTHWREMPAAPQQEVK